MKRFIMISSITVVMIFILLLQSVSLQVAQPLAAIDEPIPYMEY